ncbi:MAG: Vms1/Ankzf1 family peptidyl-tRNA hydrolase [Natronomonas sp.]
MLDDLLGRTELKERIEDLEEQNERLEAQLEAESRRRADAVSAKQTAQERINRLEDRIADLEGQVAPESDTPEIDFRREETLHGGRIEAVLSRLASFEGDPESVLTAYVDEDVPDSLREMLGERASLVSRATPCLACTDNAGVLAVALRPPVTTEPFCEWAATPRIDRSWFVPTGRFALALVRSDTFAVGVYEDNERVSFEGFESDVKSDHSKGGFSQSRFERIRDEQIENHVEKCRETLDTIGTDRLYVVGDRRLIDEFDADVTAAVDATGKPRAALEDAFADFWSVRLYGL